MINQGPPQQYRSASREEVSRQPLAHQLTGRDENAVRGDIWHRTSLIAHLGITLPHYIADLQFTCAGSDRIAASPVALRTSLALAAC